MTDEELMERLRKVASGQWKPGWTDWRLVSAEVVKWGEALDQAKALVQRVDGEPGSDFAALRAVLGDDEIRT